MLCFRYARDGFRARLKRSSWVPNRACGSSRCGCFLDRDRWERAPSCGAAPWRSVSSSTSTISTSEYGRRNSRPCLRATCGPRSSSTRCRRDRLSRRARRHLLPDRGEDRHARPAGSRLARAYPRGALATGDDRVARAPRESRAGNRSRRLGRVRTGFAPFRVDVPGRRSSHRLTAARVTAFLTAPPCFRTAAGPCGEKCGLVRDPRRPQPLDAEAALLVLLV